MGFIFTIVLYVGRTTRSRMLAYTLIALPLQIVGLYITLKFHPLDIAPTMVTFGLVGAGLVLYYAVFRAEPKVSRSHPKFLASDQAYAVMIVLFVGGIFSSGLGAFFFALTDPSSLLHSFWHFFVGIGLILLQEAAFIHPPVVVVLVSETRTAVEGGGGGGTIGNDMEAPLGLFITS